MWEPSISSAEALTIPAIMSVQAGHLTPWQVPVVIVATEQRTS